MKNLFLLSAAVLAAFSSAAMAAPCKPNLAEHTVCKGLPCATVGETALDGDEKNIVACLKADDAVGAPVWKSTTSSVGSPAVTYYTAESVGTKTVLGLGKHAYCALTQSWNNWSTQAGGCTILVADGIYSMEAEGAANIMGGKGSVAAPRALTSELPQAFDNGLNL